jgi:hypothetical protein
MPFCALCGRHVTDEESTADVRGTDEISGAWVRSRTEATAFCHPCARARRRSFYWIVAACALVLAGIALMALLD